MTLASSLGLAAQKSGANFVYFIDNICIFYTCNWANPTVGRAVEPQFSHKLISHLCEELVGTNMSHLINVAFVHVHFRSFWGLFMVCEEIKYNHPTKPKRFICMGVLTSTTFPGQAQT